MEVNLWEYLDRLYTQGIIAEVLPVHIVHENGINYVSIFDKQSQKWILVVCDESSISKKEIDTLLRDARGMGEPIRLKQGN